MHWLICLLILIALDLLFVHAAVTLLLLFLGAQGRVLDL